MTRVLVFYDLAPCIESYFEFTVILSLGINQTIKFRIFPDDSFQPSSSQDIRIIIL